MWIRLRSIAKGRPRTALRVSRGTYTPSLHLIERGATMFPAYLRYDDKEIEDKAARMELDY